jgi:hypothetical protein
MSETKACTIDEGEVKALLGYHIHRLTCEEETQESIDYHLDRLNYLNKRLKAFKEEGTPVPTPPLPQSEPTKTGW